MIRVLLAVHIMLAIAMIGAILVQRSEGGALGIGGGGGGGLMTTRGQANLLTRVTGVLAALFFVTSMALVMMAGSPSRVRSIMDQPPASTQPGPPAAPSAPTVPSVPLQR
jgi:preprotein translocase subunit SecG